MHDRKDHHRAPTGRGRTGGPHPSGAQGLLALHQAVGNAAFARIVGAPVIQRVTSTSNIYPQWAQLAVSRGSPDQSKWLWQQLLKLKTAPQLLKLTVPQALALLREANVTPEQMGAELATHSPAAPAAPEAPDFDTQADELIKAAQAAWRKRDKALPDLQKVTINVPGLGQGVVALLKSGAPSHSDTLAWFSHGYEDNHPITVNTARKYAFAIETEKSLNRLGTVEAYTSLPAAMAGGTTPATTAAPGLYVQPHHYTEIGTEIDRLIALTHHCDVAVLLSFDWDASAATNRHTVARRRETPPLPDLIEGTPNLAAYRSLLILTCRTPWADNVAALGSTELKNRVRQEVKAEGIFTDVEAEVNARVVRAPQKDTVHTALRT